MGQFGENVFSILVPTSKTTLAKADVKLSQHSMLAFTVLTPNGKSYCSFEPPSSKFPFSYHPLAVETESIAHTVTALFYKGLKISCLLPAFMKPRRTDFPPLEDKHSYHNAAG